MYTVLYIHIHIILYTYILYIYICIHIHTHAYTHIHIYIYTMLSVQKHSYTYTYIYQFDHTQFLFLLGLIVLLTIQVIISDWVDTQFPLVLRPTHIYFSCYKYKSKCKCWGLNLWSYISSMNKMNSTHLFQNLVSIMFLSAIIKSVNPLIYLFLSNLNS